MSEVHGVFDDLKGGYQGWGCVDAKHWELDADVGLYATCTGLNKRDCPANAGLSVSTDVTEEEAAKGLVRVSKTGRITCIRDVDIGWLEVEWLATGQRGKCLLEHALITKAPPASASNP